MAEAVRMSSGVDVSGTWAAFLMIMTISFSCWMEVLPRVLPWQHGHCDRKFTFPSFSAVSYWRSTGSEPSNNTINLGPDAKELRMKLIIITGIPPSPHAAFHEKPQECQRSFQRLVYGTTGRNGRGLCRNWRSFLLYIGSNTFRLTVPWSKTMIIIDTFKT